MKLLNCMRTLFLAAGIAASFGVAAQSFPSKPILWVVGFPPGGGADFVARAVTRTMAANIGQSIVVENRPGASSIIAAQSVAQAAPDGYTLFGADGGALVLNPALYAKLPYDPARDFVPVSLIIRAPQDAAVAATVGVVAPRGTPTEVVARLSAEVAKAVKDPELNKRLADLGMEPISTTPEEYTAYLDADAKRFQPLIKSLNIRLD